MSNATLEAVVPSPPHLSAHPSAIAHGSAPLSALRRIPEIERLVDGYVASWHASSACIQSRRWHRMRYAKLLVITPLDESDDIAGDSLVVTGRDISLTGLSFMHDEPLAFRKIAVGLPLEDQTWASVMTHLRWCRFRQDGLHQSGGQFVRIVRLPSDASLRACRIRASEGAEHLPAER